MSATYPIPAVRFPARDFDPANTEQLSEIFDELEQRTIASPQELHDWLLDMMDFGSRIGGEGSRRNVAHARDTTDKDAEKAFHQFVSEVGPLIATRFNKLEKKLMESPHLRELEQRDDQLQILLRNTRLDLEIFNEENTQLASKDTQTYSEYAKHIGGLTIEHEGKQLTVQQTGPLMESQDRELRETIWRKVDAARKEIRQPLQDIYDRMLALRQKMAENAGEPSYRELRFKQYHRFDYGPKECEAFHEAVAEHFVPLATKINEKRKAKMGLDTLRPWDMQVDPDGAEPFAPYKDEKELIELGTRMFERVESGFADDFRFMAENDCLDLWSRPGKAPGGFQATIDDTRRPFIFANSAGSPRDIRTVLHEGGHAFHALLSRGYDIRDYRHSPLEFAEVASMSMELMCAEHFHEIWPEEEAQRARHDQIERTASLFPSVAMIDSFQHWVYTHPGHSQEERVAKWTEIAERFSPDLDYSGIEDSKGYGWQRVLHLFKVPLLLHRVRDRADRRAPGLAQLPQGPGEGHRAVSRRPVARRQPPDPRALCHRGSALRLRQRNDG
jgi:oligoendopeptidase F